MTRSLSIPRDLPGMFRRRILHVLVPWMALTGVGIAVAYLLPDEYESHIIINLPENGSPTRSTPDEVAAYAQELVTSQPLLLALTDSLGLAPGGHTRTPSGEAIQQLSDKIAVSPLTSQSFTIRVSSPSPQLSQNAARLVAGLYARSVLTPDKQRLELTIRLLEAQTEQYGKTAVEEQSSGSRNPSSETSTTLHARLRRVEVDIAGAEAFVKYREQAMSTMTEYARTIDNPESVKRLSLLDPEHSLPKLTTVKNLAVQHADLLNRYTPRYPEVQSVRRQLEGLLQRSMQELGSEIDHMRGRIAQYRSVHTNIKAAISRDTTPSGIAGVESAATRGKNLNDEALAQLEKARIALATLEQSSGNIVLGSATVPTFPIRPNRPFIIGVGAILGMAIGLITGFLAGRFDPVIRTKSDLELFQKPVIAYLS